MATQTAHSTRGARVREFLRRRWILIVLVIVAVVFIVQNRANTTIQLFWAQVVMPQWMYLAVVFLLGLGAGLLIGRNRRRSRS
jgi:lipopolysaccharide assembly protein A